MPLGKAALECEQIGEAACRGQEANAERVGWGNDGEIVYRSQIFAHAVNAIAAADRGGVTAAHIVGEADARFPNRGVFVIESSLVESSVDTREPEFVDALGIDIGLPGRVRQFGIGVAGVAKRVIGRAEEFVAETEVRE